MAILGPEQGPVILRVPSDPIKFEILSTLGHPIVNVELTDPMLEQAIRVTGDFVAQYFPLEEKYAYFNTQPLVSTYELPQDAYMVRDVNWDPSVTRIGDIFGSESFLFCFPKLSKILDKDNSLQPINEWKTHWKAKTPYGARKLNIFKRYSEHLQNSRQLIHESGSVVTTINHPIYCVNKDEFIMNDEFNIGDKLRSINNTVSIKGLKIGGMIESYAVDVPKAQCLYVSYDGDPVLVH